MIHEKIAQFIHHYFYHSILHELLMQTIETHIYYFPPFQETLYRLSFMQVKHIHILLVSQNIFTLEMMR